MFHFKDDLNLACTMALRCSSCLALSWALGLFALVVLSLHVAEAFLWIFCTVSYIGDWWLIVRVSLVLFLLFCGMFCIEAWCLFVQVTLGLFLLFYDVSHIEVWWLFVQVTLALFLLF